MLWRRKPLSNARRPPWQRPASFCLHVSSRHRLVVRPPLQLARMARAVRWSRVSSDACCKSQLGAWSGRVRLLSAWMRTNRRLDTPWYEGTPATCRHLLDQHPSRAPAWRLTRCAARRNPGPGPSSPGLARARGSVRRRRRAPGESRAESLGRDCRRASWAVVCIEQPACAIGRRARGTAAEGHAQASLRGSVGHVCPHVRGYK